MRSALLALATAALLAGCGATFEVEIQNLDGPDVTLVINDQEIGRVPCGPGSITVRPWFGTPPLPWRLELLTAEGNVFGGTVEYDTGRSGRLVLLVRNMGILTVPPLTLDEAMVGAMGCPGP